MSVAADKKRFDDLRAAYTKAIEAYDAFDLKLHSHYGKYQPQWLKRGERDKLEKLAATRDKIGDKIFELVKRVSPRDWSHGVPVYWVYRDLTWEDAIRPKGEELSVVPPLSYGSTTPMRENKMKRNTTNDDRAQQAGEQYAQDQLQSDYFTDWVRGQISEASRMPPEKVLPLETKADALVVAKNMLQQLEWDTKRELDEQEVSRLVGGTRSDNSPAFFEGFDRALESSRDWLADELLQLKTEMAGGTRVGEARRTGGTREIREARGVVPRMREPNDLQQGITHQKYLPHLHETHYTVRVGKHVIKVIVSEKSGLFTTHAHTHGKGWASANDTAMRLVRKERASREGSTDLREPRMRETDSDYTVQGLYSDGTISTERGFEDENKAIASAQKMVGASWFEGDYTRVITRDGELVWDSRGEDEGGMREAHNRVQPRPATHLYNVVAINERTGKKEYLTATPVTHGEAVTILNKQRPHKDVRKQLELAGSRSRPKAARSAPRRQR